MKNHPFHLLFGYKKDSSSINFSDEYLSVLSESMISGQEQSLCHVGDTFCNNPIQIIGSKIYNKPVTDVGLDVMKILNKVYTDADGEKIKLILSLGMVEIVGRLFFKRMYISHLLDRISNYILEQINNKFATNYTFLGLEKPILEFKESTYWLREKNATKISESLKKEIDKKITQNPILMLVIGMDEATNIITPISNSRLKSEIINEVEKNLNNFYKFSKLLKVPVNESSSIILSITTV
jgi:hypothetical protein